MISYFRNPGYPSPYEQEGTCKMRIAKHSDAICQIRLDFLDFDLARPVEGNCSQDMLVVTGQNENNLIPKICGLNSGQHCKFAFTKLPLYIPFRVREINLDTQTDYRR